MRGRAHGGIRLISESYGHSHRGRYWRTTSATGSGDVANIAAYGLLLGLLDSLFGLLEICSDLILNLVNHIKPCCKIQLEFLRGTK